MPRAPFIRFVIHLQFVCNEFQEVYMTERDDLEEPLLLSVGETEVGRGAVLERDVNTKQHMVTFTFFLTIDIDN